VHDPSPHLYHDNHDHHALVQTYQADTIDRTDRLQRDLTSAVLKTAVTANLQKWTKEPFLGQPTHLRTFLMDMSTSLNNIEDPNVLYQALRAATSGPAQMIVDTAARTATSLNQFLAAIHAQCSSAVHAFKRESDLYSTTLVNDDIEMYIATYREILLDLQAARNLPTTTAMIRAFALGLPHTIQNEVLARASSSVDFGMEHAYACARQYFLGRALRPHNRYEPPARPERPRAPRHTTTTTSTATRTSTAPTASHQPQTPSASSTTTTSPATSTSLPTTAPPSTASNSRPRFPNKLTDAERDQLRALNGCFTCREVHQGGWKACPFPRPPRPAQTTEDPSRRPT